MVILAENKLDELIFKTSSLRNRPLHDHTPSPLLLPGCAWYAHRSALCQKHKNSRGASVTVNQLLQQSRTQWGEHLYLCSSNCVTNTFLFLFSTFSCRCASVFRAGEEAESMCAVYSALSRTDSRTNTEKQRRDPPPLLSRSAELAVPVARKPQETQLKSEGGGTPAVVVATERKRVVSCRVHSTALPSLQSSCIKVAN